MFKHLGLTIASWELDYVLKYKSLFRPPIKNYG